MAKKKATKFDYKTTIAEERKSLEIEINKLAENINNAQKHKLILIGSLEALIKLEKKSEVK